MCTHIRSVFNDMHFKLYNGAPFNGAPFDGAPINGALFGGGERAQDVRAEEPGAAGEEHAHGLLRANLTDWLKGEGATRQRLSNSIIQCTAK